MSDWGAIMGQGIARMIGQNEQLAADDAVANSLYKALKVGLEKDDGSVQSNPLGDEQAWKLKSATDRVRAAAGYMRAMALNNAMQGQQQRLQAQRSQMVTEALRQRAMQSELDSEAALGTALRNTDTGGVPGTDIPDDASPQEVNANMMGGGGDGEITPNRLLQAMSRSPASVNARGVPALLRAMELGAAARARQNAIKDFMPQAFDVNGLKGIVSPLTGAIHTQNNPSGLTFDQRVELLDRKGLLDERRSLISAMKDAFLPQDRAYYQTQLDAIESRLKTGGTGNDSGQLKELDKATAATLLQEAGGDKTKARALAKQRGYKF